MNADPSLLPPSGRDPGSRTKSAFEFLALLLIGAALLGWWIEVQNRAFICVAVELFLGWCAIVAVIQIISIRLFGQKNGFYFYITEGIAFILGCWLLFRISYQGLLYPVPLDLAPAAGLRLAAVLFLACAAILYFCSSYAKIVQGHAGAASNPLVPLSRVASVACSATAVLLFIFLSTQRDFSLPAGRIFTALTLVLALEPLVRLTVRFYLPKSQRKMPARIGSSLLLDLLFGSRRSLHALKSELEKLLGTKLGNVWILRFVRASAEAIILAGFVLGWLSTCLTTVPLGSRGVLVSFGKYEPVALEPGLHFSLPWPLEKIELVPTQRIREIALGFDQDLDGPVLWTAKHYVGEKNLLVGDGESLLTIDVPFQYRVADAVAFLKATPDSASALKSLAERRLIQAARSRESFAIMTVDRAQIADEIKHGLQQDADRLGLGVEIVFVGMKDVHPPVDVAPAYEKVVSAEETRAATIYVAKAYEASILPDAQAQAQRLLAAADAGAIDRLDRATGEATRFSILAAAEHDAPALYRTRVKYDVLDNGLAAPVKFIVGGQNVASTCLDLRARRDMTPFPSAAPSQAQPPFQRTSPVEMPEH